MIILSVFIWKPFSIINKGKLAVIGDSSLGTSIYLLNPFFRLWHRVTPQDLQPFHMAWSPDGKSIAFTYSTGKQDDAQQGIAILKLENMETERVYIAPSDEYLNLVVWTPDGHALIFDVNEQGHLTSFQKLDLQNNELQSIPIPSSNLTQIEKWSYLQDMIITKDDNYVIADSHDSIYITSPDFEIIRHIADGTDFFLTPDGRNITIFCYQNTFCNYNLNTNEVAQISFGTPPYPELKNGGWSYDGKDMIYLSGYGGEGDSQYIILLDTSNKKYYTVNEIPWGLFMDRINIWQMAWYSAK